MKTLTKEETLSLLTGASALGCGGGGELEWGKYFVNTAFKINTYLPLIEIAELKEKDLIAIVGLVGGASANKLPDKDLLLAIENSLLLLEKHINSSITAILPSEIGAGNIGAPLYVAMKLGKYLIDGDTCGRAKPETSISTTTLAGISPTPLCAVNQMKESLILNNLDSIKVEKILRFFAIFSEGVCAVTRCVAPAGDYKKAVISGSISLAFKIGEILLKTNYSFLKERLVNLLPAYKSFEGIVIENKKKDGKDFIEGEIKIKGEKGILRVWYKNEFLIAWLNDSVWTACPDAIIILDLVTRQGISNWKPENFYINKEVLVLTKKAHPLWYTKEGQALFSPGHFGFEEE